MTTLIVNALQQPAFEIVIHLLEHISVYVCDGSGDVVLQVHQSPCEITDLRYPHKKSQGDKSGERTGQGRSPLKEMRRSWKFSLNSSMEHRAVCAVAPSCSNHTPNPSPFLQVLEGKIL